ncbi:MAG: Rho termination factor N-terminal domain-containing protein, partial [Brachybacterium sp.]|nr:Rho termination factor N-terminal domain-containing protein [Brachybacterium sp.]
MNDTTSGADLAAKKLPELQALAAERGIKGARRLRKGELIEAIRGGGTPPTAAADAPSAPASAPAQEAPAAQPAQSEPSAQDDAGTAAADRNERSRSRSRSRATTAGAARDDSAPELGLELPVGSGARAQRGDRGGDAADRAP